ncbi:hypothetical protein DFR74_11283 [Nocardia puris]|uniref:Uncharacterized protein n=1 Tax=Nocardia puris TaxID=208602 RepID=A0A366DA25_9NOCA|nr:hypothetical protein DFR74_11283 [Nocardia puris]
MNYFGLQSLTQLLPRVLGFSLLALSGLGFY